MKKCNPTWELHGAPDAREAVAAGEIHVELHGEKLRGRVVLVRTGEGRSGKESWLVLHKRDDGAVNDWNPEDYPRSVISGHTNDEIADLDCTAEVGDSMASMRDDPQRPPALE